MISTVRGIVLETDPEIVVEVGGLGLTVQMPAGDAARLPASGETVRLWTHLAVREDQWNLFGFLERETRTLYRLLLGVSGIGPKVALGMLSGASPAAIALALHRGDEKTLVGLPGVGKKSAARMVVELGSKVPGELLSDASPEAGASSAADAAAEITAERRAAEAMLASMGLPSPRAAGALDAALDEDAGLGDDPVRWVKAALRRLG